MNTAKSALLAACFLLTARPAPADSVILGSDLSQVSHAGAGLCPSFSNCEVLAQQFTLLYPTLIDQIKVQMSGPDSLLGNPGSFSVDLENPLGTPIDSIGSGTLTYVSGTYATQLFSFGNLNILLNPGTYYLGINGGDIGWNSAPALTTPYGTLGAEFACDPTVSHCSDPTRWGSGRSGAERAMEIDGTAITPEPSSWLLLGTPLLATCAARLRRFCKLPAR